MLMQASDDRSQALAESEDVVEGEPELSREFSFSHSVQEPLVELGQAFLIKLQNKGMRLSKPSPLVKPFC